MSYRRGSDGDLIPATVGNPASVWSSDDNFQVSPMDNADRQYRTLRQHTIARSMKAVPTLTLTGTFSQAKIQAFDPLSRVPLGL